MDELFIELSLRIANQRLIISSLSEKCRVLLKPWKCEATDEAKANPPEDDELDVAEKQQLEMLETVLQKAVKIRTIIDQKDQIQQKNKNTCSSSKQQNKPLSDEMKHPSRPNTRLHSSNNKSVIALSQLQSLSANKTQRPSSSVIHNVTSNSPRKKFKPVHMSAPYKTFAQFKFPCQPRIVSQKISVRRDVKSSSGQCSSQKSIKKIVNKQETISSDFTNIPSSVPSPTHPSNHPSNVGCHSSIEIDPTSHADDYGKFKRDDGDLNSKGKELNTNNSRVVDDITMPSFASLADIGRFLRMPPEYSDLSSRNDVLKREIENKFSKFDSRNNKFFESLQSHMKNDPEVRDLLTSHEMIRHCKALHHLCNDVVGCATFSERNSNSHPHQILNFISIIKREFESRSEEANYLINKGMSCSNYKDGHDSDLLKTKADDILSRGSTSSIVRYRDLREINEYQKSYERLISLRIKKHLFTLLMPFIELLKSVPSDSENFRQMYRSIYSLVNANGHAFPAFIGNINDDLLEPADY